MLKRIGNLFVIVAIAASLFLGTGVSFAMAGEDLPLPDPEFTGTIKATYEESDPDIDIMKGPQPPMGKDSPNIMLVLLDDVGFGASSAFGGPVFTPTLNELVQNGLSYNRFHTTALCAPTRAALLTGRNHHSAATGTIQEMSTGFPGYSGLIPQSTATIGQILQAHGYTTGWFGKNHNVPDNQTSALGPFNRWPNDLGFDYFYGFIGGETDQWYPTLYDNRTPINQPASPEEGYNLTKDLANKAINWVRYNHSLSPDTPFFLYFSPGATHAPHQPPSEYVDKYKKGGERAVAAGAVNGMFVDGWDVEQAAICANQKTLGVIPLDAKCTERPAKEIPAWDDSHFDTPGARDLLALQMQTYAGFLEYTDEQVGRVIDAIDALGEKENTLIIYIVGDNGASGEGSIPGTCNEISNLMGLPLTMEQNLECLEEWGGPETSPHYAVGWAWAMDSPFRWTKQVASYFGGTRNPMVISWPDGIDAKGDRKEDMRSQFLHVIDVAPTLLEVTGIEAPDEFNGIPQKPIEGASFFKTFGSDGASAVAQRDTQYFEMFAHRGIYQDGWMASAFHRVPWDTTANDDQDLEDDLEDDQWELFNLEEDFTQAHDLSATNQEKLEKMKDVFLVEATKHNVFPIDDRTSERFFVPRPTVLGDRTHFEFYEGAIRLPGASAPNVGNTSYAITAELSIEEPVEGVMNDENDEGVHGVILANGGTTGGYTFYVNPKGKLVYEYNYFNTQRTKLISPEPLPKENVTVKFEFVYDGNFTCTDESGQPTVGCGGMGFLYVNDMNDSVVEKRIEKTVIGKFGIDTQDVGMDLQAPVSKDYKPPFEFTGGTIEKVTIDLYPADEFSDDTQSDLSEKPAEPSEEMSNEDFWNRIIQEILR